MVKINFQNSRNWPMAYSIWGRTDMVQKNLWTWLTDCRGEEFYIAAPSPSLLQCAFESSGASAVPGRASRPGPQTASIIWCMVTPELHSQVVFIGSEFSMQSTVPRKDYRATRSLHWIPGFPGQWRTGCSNKSNQKLGKENPQGALECIGIS